MVGIIVWKQSLEQQFFLQDIVEPRSRAPAYKAFIKNPFIIFGFKFPTKPDQPGLSSWIQLEVIKDKKIFRLEVVM